MGRNLIRKPHLTVFRVSFPAMSHVPIGTANLCAHDGYTTDLAQAQLFRHVVCQARQITFNRLSSPYLVLASILSLLLRTMC